MNKSAIISDDEVYRYELRRIWEPLLPLLCIVGLNPSTADAEQDDPTIRRCIGFAKTWHHGGIVMVNLFAFRATDPKEMKKSLLKAIGPENDRYIMRAVEECDMVLAAWGANGDHQGRDLSVRRMINAKKQMRCLGTTRQGKPRHPLYIKGDTLPEAF